MNNKKHEKLIYIIRCFLLDTWGFTNILNQLLVKQCI